MTPEINRQTPGHTPVGTRVSTRANKGKTSKYDDFVRYDDIVQQITAKVQQLTEQVQQLTNMEILKENNTQQLYVRDH